MNKQKAFNYLSTKLQRNAARVKIFVFELSSDFLKLIFKTLFVLLIDIELNQINLGGAFGGRFQIY